MAKYHLRAEQLREIYDQQDLTFNNKTLNFILDCMRGCSQLRQSKVIESFFIELFPNLKTEYTEIDGKFGKFQKLKVIE